MFEIAKKADQLYAHIKNIFDGKYCKRNSRGLHSKRSNHDRVNLAIQVETLDRGGLEQVVVNLVRNIDKGRFNVTLLVCSDEAGCMGELLKEQGFDVVALGRDKGALKRVIHEREIDVVNLHFSIWGVDVYCKSNVSMIYTIHTSYTWLSKQELKARGKAFREIDRFIAVSGQVRDYAAARFDIPVDKIATVPNGMDITDFASPCATARSHYGLKDNDFVFINVATITPLKMHNLMLSALKLLVQEHPDVKLLFVGNVADKKYHDFLAGRIENENLSGNVVILDFVPKEELGGLLQMADCFLLPSLQEGWNNAVMEAMHFGLPLILSDVGSARDVIAESDIGLVIPNPYDDILALDCAGINELAYNDHPRNLDNLIAAMKEMVTSPDVWKAKGLNGVRKIAVEFTVGRMVQAYEREISETCRSHVN